MIGPRLSPRDPSDMLLTIAAEDAFDVESSLGCVRARTLVRGGGRDPWYSEDLFRRTAAGIPGGRVQVFSGKGHLFAATSKASIRMSREFFLES